MLQMCLWLTDFKVLVTNSGRNWCNVSNWHWQHRLRGRWSVLQRWFTQSGGESTIEIDLKFIRADGLSQKKEKGLFTVIVVLTLGLLILISRVILYLSYRQMRKINKVMMNVTMTMTVMVNWAVMVFICRQSEPARPRACHSLRTAFTRRHTMWHHTLDAVFV